MWSMLYQVSEPTQDMKLCLQHYTENTDAEGATATTPKTAPRPAQTFIIFFISYRLIKLHALKIQRSWARYKLPRPRDKFYHLSQ